MKADHPRTFTCTTRGIVHTGETKSVVEAARKALLSWAVEPEPYGFAPLNEEIIKVSVEGGATHRLQVGEVRSAKLRRQRNVAGVEASGLDGWRLS
jgi:hypothetical protein